MPLSDTPAPMLSVQDLSVWFGDTHNRFQAVDTVSFTLAAGESLGLVGESGSGKSTILKAITHLATDISGHIHLDGTPLTGPRDKSFYSTVQMVFQDPYASLHPRHTVDRCLSEPLRLQGATDIDNRVRQVLEEVGLGAKFRFRYPHQLSGGQRQRVAIARALVQNARLLLLDEPTSALDVSVQAEILNLLSDLRKDRGLTFLFVSHDLAVISHMCDRILVMHQGKITEVLQDKQLQSGTAETPYTQGLIEASRGFTRKEMAGA